MLSIDSNSTSPVPSLSQPNDGSSGGRPCPLRLDLTFPFVTPYGRMEDNETVYCGARGVSEILSAVAVVAIMARVFIDGEILLHGVF